MIAGVVLCLVVLIILADVAYRVYAARQIQHLIENVPPFGAVSYTHLTLPTILLV